MEFPHLQKISEEFKDRGLVVLAVNEGDTAEQITEYLRENKITFRTVMNERGGANDAVKKYQVRAFPTTYLIGKDGKILKGLLGFHPQQGERRLREALAEVGFKLEAR